VKRHAALVGLSHDHHHELVQARRLRAAADEDEAARLAAARAYVDLFFTETVRHFRDEEEVLFPAFVRRVGVTPDLRRVLDEHMQLHGLVRALRAEVAGGDVRSDSLRRLGDLLHEHVRLEERQLFPAVEEALGDEGLRELSLPGARSRS
jgi:hemerythrin-like domain-containing protein